MKIPKAIMKKSIILVVLSVGHIDNYDFSDDDGGSGDDHDDNDNDGDNDDDG